MRLNLIDGGVMIYAYTRAQAIDDGTLVDVSDLARDAGFKVPVALTAKVWSDCVAWDQAREVAFSVLRIGSGRLRPSRVTLALVIGPGDQGEPVITIMQPEED